MSAKQQDFCIEQGKTFSRTVRWETSPLVYKAITAIGNVAPVLITAPGHSVLDGWRVGVINVQGMLDINAGDIPPRDRDFHAATVVSPSQISLNDVSAADYDLYVSGGYVVYYTPVDLTGFSARMKIKDRIGGTVLLSLVSGVSAGLSGIVLNTTLQTITIFISATDTASAAWVKGVYDLELVSAAGIVTAVLTGAVTLTAEVTTT